MKKMMFVAAMAAMVLSSCAKEETLNQSKSNAIGFESFVGKPTKGVPVAAFAENATMSIYGYTTAAAMGETFAGAVAIPNLAPATATLKSSVWGYTPAAYWTVSSFHTFFAVSPATITVTDGVAAISVNDDVAQQEDLMVADPEKQQAAYADGGATTVPFKFRHVLSQVKFSARIVEQATSLATDVKITGLVIKPTAQGEFFKKTGDVSIVGKANGNTDAYTITNPAGEAAQYEITPTTAVAPTVAPTADYAAINHQDTNIAMLLPQDAPAFTITVSVSYKDVNSAPQTATFDVKASAMTWAANTIYNYKMDISVPKQVLNLKPIEIGTVDIEPWTTTEIPGDFE